MDMQVFIKMQPNFRITITGGLLDQITNASFFKINIKRFVNYVAEDAIVFREDLSYLVFKRIISTFEKQSVCAEFELFVCPEVTEYISKREMFLETRSKLGMEIKNQDAKLADRFKQFCTIVNANMMRQLREKQMWDSFFMVTMKKSSNFSVPGSGKTSAVYGMYTFLKAQGLAKRIVVICPKNAFGPWIDEYSACFGSDNDLNLFNIHSSDYHGAYQKKNALKYECGSANLLLFNYECIKSFEREISNLIDENTILVFDEVHKVKRINGEYANAAISIAKAASYAVAMTGTPIPNSYQDIYNLLHILYGEDYDDFFSFQIAGLRNPTTVEIDRVNRKLQPFFCRTTKNQLNVPPANSDSLIPVGADNEEVEIFKVLLNKHKKNKLLLMLRILQLESAPELLLSAIDLADYQYILEDDRPVEEIDYADYSHELLERIQRCKTSTKTQQCVNLVRGLTLQNKPVVVWCIFVKSIKNLASLFRKEGIRVKCVYGDILLEERQQILEDFKNRAFDVLITNPNTLAEAISLHTVCHDAVYFEYSFNLVHLLQSKDRIHRLGLQEKQYTQFYFLQTMYSIPDGYYSMDEQIYNRLQDKEKTMLAAIDVDILEQVPTTEEELDMIFSKIL